MFDRVYGGALSPTGLFENFKRRDRNTNPGKKINQRDFTSLPATETHHGASGLRFHSKLTTSYYWKETFMDRHIVPRDGKRNGFRKRGPSKWIEGYLYEQNGDTKLILKHPDHAGLYEVLPVTPVRARKENEA